MANTVTSINMSMKDEEINFNTALLDRFLARGYLIDYQVVDKLASLGKYPAEQGSVSRYEAKSRVVFNGAEIFETTAPAVTLALLLAIDFARNHFADAAFGSAVKPKIE